MIVVKIPIGSFAEDEAMESWFAHHAYMVRESASWKAGRSGVVVANTERLGNGVTLYVLEFEDDLKDIATLCKLTFGGR